MKLKHLFPFLFLFCLAAVAAPGEPLKTNSVTLGWDAPGDIDQVTSVQVYFRTSFPTGMPHTNSVTGQPMNWIPTDTNGWSQILTLPGRPTICDITNLPPFSACFFVVTFSNVLGESFFSNVAWRPAAPSSSDKNLRIQQLR